jgi:hypothetical protein
LPNPYTILGVKLEPYSLGHYLIMQRFDCAFVSDDTNRCGGIEDLLLGIAICSRTYDDFLAFIRDDAKFDAWMKAWREHIMSDMYSWYARKSFSVCAYIQGSRLFPKSLKAIAEAFSHTVRTKKTHKINFLHQMMRFRDYTMDGYEVPKFDELPSKEAKNVSGAHWSQSIIHILTSEVGYTFSEAVNMPLSKAIFEYFKCLENKGVIKLMEDDDISDIEALAEGKG